MKYLELILYIAVSVRFNSSGLLARMGRFEEMAQARASRKNVARVEEERRNTYAATHFAAYVRGRDHWAGRRAGF